MTHGNSSTKNSIGTLTQRSLLVPIPCKLIQLHFASRLCSPCTQTRSRRRLREDVTSRPGELCSIGSAGHAMASINYTCEETPSLQAQQSIFTGNRHAINAWQYTPSVISIITSWIGLSNFFGLMNFVPPNFFATSSLWSLISTQIISFAPHRRAPSTQARPTQPSLQCSEQFWNACTLLCN